MYELARRHFGRYKGYEQAPNLLPTRNAVSEKSARLRCNFRPRRSVCLLLTIPFLLSALFLISRIRYNVSIGFPLLSPYIIFKAPDSLPPLYSNYNQNELQLPQHKVDPDSSEGREQKFFWIANHVRGLGWGNVMQELLLNHYLAYSAGRSFVFRNYTWDDGGSQYSYWKGHAIPSYTPLSAIIRGPTAGAAMMSDPDAPLAVRKEYWDEACPHPRIIQNGDITATFDREPTAEMMLDAWVNELKSTDNKCVEVPRDSTVIFDLSIFANRDRLLDIFPSFAKSPIMREFGWSPLIERAFDANREIFAPISDIVPLVPVPFTTNAERYTPIPGLLALHVRRGDYEGHCLYLAKHSEPFVGYNSFPQFVDTFAVPPGMSEQERRAWWRPRCFPDVELIVQKVEAVRAAEAAAARGLRNVYIMTNGPAEWVDGLKAALGQAGHWDNIASSRDLLLDLEQDYVKQAVDILIGQRAQVIIGNGFSSMTGQAVMLRMANGMRPDSNRFW